MSPAASALNDYWGILDEPVRALCLAAASLEETVPGEDERGHMRSTVMCAAVGLGLVILGRERPEGGSVEITTTDAGIRVWGSCPGDTATRTLYLLGWHDGTEGEGVWRHWT